MKKTALTLILASAMIAPIAAHADISERDFRKADADRSGTLSAKEFGKLDSDAEFSTLDVNKDKMLSMNEVTATIATPGADTSLSNTSTSTGSQITGDSSVGSPNNGTTGSSGSAGMSNSGSSGTTSVQ